MYVIYNHGPGQLFLKHTHLGGIYINGRSAINLEEDDFELAVALSEVGRPLQVSGGEFDENSSEGPDEPGSH